MWYLFKLVKFLLLFYVVCFFATAYAGELKIIIATYW